MVEVKASIEVGEMGVPLPDRTGEREPIVLLVSFSPAVEFQEASWRTGKLISWLLSKEANEMMN